MSLPQSRVLAVAFIPLPSKTPMMFVSFLRDQVALVTESLTLLQLVEGFDQWSLSVEERIGW